ncbi:MAG: sulfurtransferase, partial [Planctomycetes bacterium]|nr:sulfurtransferase [Planctomycetota bacterium]
MTKPILVQPAELRTMLSDPKVVLIDCAHHAAEYSRAHIAGAILRPKHAYVKGLADDGLFLPQPDEMTELAEIMGVGTGSTVVCYDSGGGIFAARLWWVLKYYGHDDVRLLDGGWQGWIADGGAISCKAS